MSEASYGLGAGRRTAPGVAAGGWTNLVAATSGYVRENRLVARRLVRALLEDVVLNIDRDKHAGTVELFWHGGARTVLPVRLKAQRNRTDRAPGQSCLT